MPLIVHTRYKKKEINLDIRHASLISEKKFIPLQKKKRKKDGLQKNRHNNTRIETLHIYLE